MYNSVYTVLKRTKEQINALGQSICPIVFDVGLLSRAGETRGTVWCCPFRGRDALFDEHIWRHRV